MFIAISLLQGYGISNLDVLGPRDKNTSPIARPQALAQRARVSISGISLLAPECTKSALDLQIATSSFGRFDRHKRIAIPLLRFSGYAIRWSVAKVAIRLHRFSALGAMTSVGTE